MFRGYCPPWRDVVIVSATLAADGAVIEVPHYLRRRMSMEEPSVRQQLRRRTADAHQRVDELGDRVASVLSPAGYLTFLLSMHSVIARYDQELDRSSRLAGVEPRAAALLAALCEDLIALGATGLPAVGPLDADPLPVNDAAAWGVGYALEGSALGAAVLLDRLRSVEVWSNGDTPPSAYLSLLVAQRPTRWPTFSSGLGALSSPTLVDDAVAAANHVFGSVQAAFLAARSVAVSRADGALHAG